MQKLSKKLVMLMVITLVNICACGDNKDEAAQVILYNNFDNPDMPYQPLWTICKSSYLGVEFAKIGWGEKSAQQEVKPGLDYVYMVAAWEDSTCAAENCLPIASKNEEEVVDGQTSTIEINFANHQGPCPPREGVAPIPEALYNHILELWPDYNFLPYAERTQNTQCLPDDA